MSTHYTHYDLTYFTINCLAVLAVVIPKLPSVRTTINFLLLVFFVCNQPYLSFRVSAIS